MLMVCPRCQLTYEQQIVCPTCGVRLEYTDKAKSPSSITPVVRTAAGEDLWQQTPWGRIIAGVLLAQGLYYGLYQLCVAILLATFSDREASTDWFFLTLPGLLLRQGFQALGLLLGGALVGASQRRGWVYGAVVGLLNGTVFLVVDLLTSKPFSALLLYAQPLLHAAVGALAGYLGSVIWKPLPVFLTQSHSPLTPFPEPALKTRSPRRPVVWVRVLVGIAIAVGGSLWASVILQFILDASEGRIAVQSKPQQRLVTWEIAVIATFAGSALAGATTGTGVKQGLLVGVGAGLIILGIHVAGQSEPAHAIVFDLANLRTRDLSPPVQASVFTMLSTLVLGVVGGWFGNQLLPPSSPLLRRKSARVGPV